jgi:hypothetical protein
VMLCYGHAFDLSARYGRRYRCGGAFPPRKDGRRPVERRAAHPAPRPGRSMLILSRCVGVGNATLLFVAPSSGRLYWRYSLTHPSEPGVNDKMNLKSMSAIEAANNG